MVNSPTLLSSTVLLGQWRLPHKKNKHSGSLHATFHSKTVTERNRYSRSGRVTTQPSCYCPSIRADTFWSIGWLICSCVTKFSFAGVTFIRRKMHLNPLFSVLYVTNILEHFCITFNTTHVVRLM